MDRAVATTGKDNLRSAKDSLPGLAGGRTWGGCRFEFDSVAKNGKNLSDLA